MLSPALSGLGLWVSSLRSIRRDEAISSGIHPLVAPNCGVITS
jgi:hypothetical protein